MNDILEKSCEICELLPNISQSLIIAEDQYWIANLGLHDQGSLGRVYITLKRHASELDELSDDEEVAFRIMRNNVIRSVRQQFQPITFNISCLKNDAFRQEPDATPSSAAHVHWHIIPRYGTQPVEFASETFEDPNPGRYLLPTRQRKEVSIVVANKIANAIRETYSTHNSAL